MAPLYEEEVHAPIFILTAFLLPQRKTGLEYFIPKVYGSLEQPCWLGGAEVVILIMECNVIISINVRTSCSLIEPTSRIRFLISENWKFLNHSTHKIGGLHWWLNMSSKMTASWPWKRLHDRQRCQTLITCLLHPRTSVSILTKQIWSTKCWL